ncbi:GNAT family N-acetyltransferase [Facklamia sp. 7083-14-GEN3]|uniref:GNAT family N-acetyltransferase n=1 Tax=Facklamia sp. 7083-14-GEN3 TaxID=2973478 RepID=UPI00215BB2AA|nr:GNAT family N-acetyltransferase [Facklamia sp. 7083-14-GEN3]MCR8969724.1 GNAT family N-acetyltransferase [Facklamia sp. 7083-14-GEN3]
MKQIVNKSNWRIRRVELKDIEKLQAIYDQARQFQLATGNLNQWIEGYPGNAVILDDYHSTYSYLVEDKIEGKILAIMALIPGEDPTYKRIQGQWLNDEEYVTIHRLAALPSAKGSGQALLEWAMAHYSNIRIDTHEANRPMKHILEKLGFTFCGIIHLENGDPRDAYQYYRKKGNAC